MSVLGHRLRAYVRPTAGTWTPAELPSLVVWYDADTAGDFTLSGSNITQWNDKSGNARHLTNTGTVTRQTNVQNGRAVARFAVGNSAYLQHLAGSTFLTGATIGFGWVGTMNSASHPNARLAAITNNAIHDYDSAVRAILTNRDSSNQTVSMAVNLSGPSSTLSVTYATWMVGSMDITSGTVSMRKDGGTAVTGSVSPAWDVKLFRMGAGHSSGTDYWDGDVGEMVLTSTITSTNREKLEGYLAWRWGLQANLPGGHPYASAAP